METPVRLRISANGDPEDWGRSNGGVRTVSAEIGRPMSGNTQGRRDHSCFIA